MAIILQETQRALFYAPFYAAIARGAYEAAGIHVEFREAAAPADAARAVLAGDIDVAWGGPMRVMLSHERDAASDLVCFCEVVTRDPFFLVGARPREGFALTELGSLRIGAVKEVPTPWLCLQDDLRRAGLDPATLDVSFDRSMSENVQALRGGDVDVIQTLEPWVDELAGEGRGHIWYAAAERGATSYTCFYARRAVLTRKRPMFEAMTRAMHDTQQWIHDEAPHAIAQVVAPFFANEPLPRLARAIQRYQRAAVWGIDPCLPREGFERLRAALLSGGLIRGNARFEDVVDNTLAMLAVAAKSPGVR